jgi:hypothetical protein
VKIIREASFNKKDLSAVESNGVKYARVQDKNGIRWYADGLLRIIDHTHLEFEYNAARSTKGNRPKEA